MREVEWIGDVGGFEALEPEWDALAAEQGDRSPFDLHCWYLAWWRAFAASEDELAICALREEGELTGVFPLRRRGRDLMALANVHTPVFRPLARDRETMAELIAPVAAAARDLELPYLPARGAWIGPLGEGVRAAAAVSFTERAQVSPTVDTSGDLEQWRKGSKPRWGAPLERFRRKMSRDHKAAFTIVESPVDLGAELAEGYRVEASGWKGQAGTAINSEAATESFYTGVARAFERRDELRLSRIVLDGEAVAFDLALLHANRLHLLKTGFDERFRKLAPGLVMRLAIIERCFEVDLLSHELLGDESDWKAKFQTGLRPYVTFRSYPRRPVGLGRYAYRAALRPRLRNAYRRLRPA